MDDPEHAGRAGLLEHPRARLALVALGVALGLPSLAIGFFSDDWFMLAALRRRWPTAPPWWDLYHFVPSSDEGIRAEVSHGVLPWFTAPSLRVHLVRPLTSAVHAFDERVFGGAAIGWHLHTLAWWCVLLVGVAALYRRLLPGKTANLALLIFAMIPAQSQTYAWISSRHMLLACVPVVLALLAHIKAREDGWAPGRALAPLGLTVALLASEAALGGVALLLAYEAFGPGAPRSRGARFRAALPSMALACLYLVAYRVAGGQMESNDAYIQPLSHPLAFASMAAAHLPLLLGSSLLGIMPELTLAGVVSPYVLSGVVATALAAWLLAVSWGRLEPRERSSLRFLLPGAILATLVTCGGLPGGRMLLIANLGFAPLLAVLIVRGRGCADGASTRAQRFASGLFFTVHVALAPLALLAGAGAILKMRRDTDAVAAKLLADTGSLQRVFSLVASDPMVNVYVAAELVAESTRPLPCLARVATARADYRVTRVDAETVAVEPIGKPLMTSTFETLYRTRSLPFHVGDEVFTCGATVRVTAVDSGVPTRVELRLGESLDSPDVALVAWDGERLARQSLSVGETRVIPWRPGPMATQ